MARKKLSGLRKPPDAEDLTYADINFIAEHGVQNWVRLNETRDWDEIADVAVKMALANYGVDDICRILKIEKAEFTRNIDIEAVHAILNGEVAAIIYEEAIVNRDEKMLKIIADRKLDWVQKKEVKHGGIIGVRPVLNVSLMSPADELAIKESSDIEADFEEVG